MVQFKYNNKYESNSKQASSQFHYGSIQINPEVAKALEGLRVSIPLWFNSNLKTGGLTPPVFLCLNSTMVQFKSC